VPTTAAGESQAYTVENSNQQSFRNIQTSPMVARAVMPQPAQMNKTGPAFFPPTYITSVPEESGYITKQAPSKWSDPVEAIEKEIQEKIYL
jgi:hypothetical protein